MLSDELSILALYGLLVAVTLVLQATGYMNKLDRALNNSIVAMALFAPAVLIIVLRDASSAQTILMAQIFLLARLVYVPAYIFGIIGVRTLAWGAGFVATCVLFLLAL